MKISRCARIGAIAVLATLVLSGTGWAFVPVTLISFDFIPCPDEYNANFVEVRRAPDITSGLDQGGTGHCAVNFTGSARQAGDTWLTRYNGTGGINIFNAFDSVCVQASVLISRFNNAKGGGLVALLNTELGDKGLFLLLINNGNMDRLTLNTIDPNNGTIVELASVPLGSAIVENAWYNLVLAVEARTNMDRLQVFANVLSHANPLNPNTPLVGVIGTLEFESSLSGQGLEQSGFVGMAAWAKLATVNTSITNLFALAPCFPP